VKNHPWRQEKSVRGIIGANVRSGWGRDAHIPALSALPEFEIAAVCTTRQETADETAQPKTPHHESARNVRVGS
jgi:hypothetical protein